MPPIKKKGCFFGGGIKNQILGDFLKDFLSKKWHFSQYSYSKKCCKKLKNLPKFSFSMYFQKNTDKLTYLNFDVKDMSLT